MESSKFDSVDERDEVINELWNVVGCWRLECSRANRSRELCYTANFVYTTVSKVYNALLSKS